MEDNIIEIEDESGKKYKLEILDIITKNDVDYVVALPDDSEDEVVILEVKPEEDSDEATYVEVEDDELADEIFNEYMKKLDDEDKKENNENE